ncbi:MAG: WecB/TagA/CpsF family glycosyltransferase [Patescibacteria group bacterium]
MITGKTARKQVNIMGINVDSTTRSQVLTNIGNYLSHNKKFYLVTPNPEIILQAQTNHKLASSIGNADFSIPDGIGLKIFGNSELNIIHGRHLMLDLFELANKRRLKVFFITSNVKKTNEKLLKKYHQEYSDSYAQAMVGPALNTNAEPATHFEAKVEKDLVEKITKFKPSMVFVCFGAPKQEIWMNKWLPKLNTLGMVGIGGALDYYAGTQELPPVWMEKLQLEWAWRLITQPARAKRIFNAVIVFPLKRFFDA